VDPVLGAGFVYRAISALIRPVILTRPVVSVELDRVVSLTAIRGPVLLVTQFVLMVRPVILGIINAKHHLTVLVPVAVVRIRFSRIAVLV
jgi:hypothetical protein